MGSTRNDRMMDALINRLSESHTNAKEAKQQFAQALNDLTDRVCRRDNFA